jgi:hypothetical protein
MKNLIGILKAWVLLYGFKELNRIGTTGTTHNIKIWLSSPNMLEPNP